MKARDKRRIEVDEKITEMLKSEAQKSKLWAELAVECSKSSLSYLLEQAIQLDGDIVECGVFRGNSIRRIGHSVRDSGLGKTIYACDSYEGFPDGNICAEDTSFLRPKAILQKKFKIAEDVPVKLKAFFEAYEIDGRIVKGYFSDTLGTINGRTFCFIHLDCDTYKSHIECLNILFPSLSVGGVIVLDDYHQPKWPGATKAIDAFFSNRPEKIEYCDARSTPAWFIRKTAA